MVQVQELVGLMADIKINGIAVALNWIFWTVQPCKERARSSYEFQGADDSTRERSEVLATEECRRRAAELFVGGSQCKVPDQTKAFSMKRPPLTVSTR